LNVNDTETPVTVLTLSPAYHLHGMMSIVRSLGRLGVAVYVAHPQRWAPADFSRFAAGRFAVKLDDSAPERLLDDLLRIGGEVGTRPILIPIDDVATLFVDDHAAALRERFLFPERAPGLARALSNKEELGRLAERLGVPTPQTLVPRSRQDVVAFAERAQYPVVVKAIDPMLLRSRALAKSVVIVEDPDTLLQAYENLEVAANPNLLLQEYIPGDATTIWIFNGYFNERSQCLVGFTGTKVRQYPPYTGPACLSVCLSNPTVEAITKRFLNAVGYRGIIDLGYRYDRRDGRYKILDVNPRIGASFRTFVAGNGMDVARALYLDLTGQPVPASSPVQGRRWMVEHHDLIASRQYHRDGQLPVMDWIRSLRGVEETAWFAWDDPGPFAALCVRSSLLTLQRAGTRFRRTKRPAWEQPRDRLPAAPRRKLGRTVAFQRRGDAHSRRGDGGLSDPPGDGQQQQLTNAFFESQAPFWRDVYDDENNVSSVIYRYRRTRTLALVDRLGLPSGSRVLEVGAGAGFTSIALAERRFRVEAMDSVPAMLDLTRQHAVRAGVGSGLHVTLGDAHALPYEDGAFCLVLALGVIPWLHSSLRGVREMARVLQPGGYLILSADNRARLNHLIDPRFNPALKPVRQAVKHVLVALGLWRPVDSAKYTFHGPAEVDRIISSAGLERVDGFTFGFGPFTLLGRELLSGPTAVRLHDSLQRLAERKVPVIRSTGAQYLLAARKPLPAPD
jgi:D-aspartate ligase